MIALQVGIVFFWLGKIAALRTGLSQGKDYYIHPIYVRDDQLNDLSAEKIVDELDIYFKEPEEHQAQMSRALGKNFVSINLLFAHGANSLMLSILRTIDKYLIKNQKTVTDFNLIRDMVERRTRAAELAITQMISVPLLLGLVGTIVGIIIGLGGLNIGASQDLSQFDKGISSLLGSVQIAMSASLAGLIGTLLLSWRYRNAKTAMEERKNEFYDFIQTELLPNINKSLADTLVQLRDNLAGFNHTFSSNLAKMEVIYDKNYTATLAQQKMIEHFETMDVKALASVNQTTLTKLQKVMGSFDEFVQFFDHLAGVHERSGLLIDKVDKAISSFDKVQGITTSMETRLEEFGKVAHLLFANITEVNALKGAFSNAVGQADVVMTKALENMKSNIEKRTDELINYSAQQADSLTEAIKANQPEFAHLGRLPEIKERIEQLNSSSGANTAKMVKELDGIEEAINRLNAQVNKADQTAKAYVQWRQDLSLKSFFGMGKRTNGVKKRSE